MKSFLQIILLLFIAQLAIAQTTRVTGKVTDSETQQPIIGVNIIVKGKLTGAVTDSNGTFELNTSATPPLTLIVSMIGYDKKEVEVNDISSISITLSPAHDVLNEVVVSASRVEENILESPVSIEKMDLRDINTTPSVSFYDGLQNLKGVEMVTSGLTFNQINTRGFNSTGNSRFL